MTNKPHHQKYIDRGKQRIKQATFNASIIWKIPYGWTCVNGFGISSTYKTLKLT